jgi:hypothetical protein
MSILHTSLPKDFGSLRVSYISSSHVHSSLVLCITVSGTSASAPVMAGFVALVNSARLAAGKAPLGNVCAV